MEFKILGPLEVVDGGQQVHVGGARQRAVLALLLLQANRVVSIDRLVDQLWAGSPPPGAATTLRGYVHTLRKVLEPERATGRPSRVVLTQPPGYLLVVAEEQLDARRFERLAAEGRQRLAAGDAEAACSLLTQALGLWRGPALADFGFEDFAQTEAARLEELRLTATEDLMQAALHRGDTSSLVAELGRLVEAHPLRERLRGLLMLALYRSGRQAAALAAYQQGRRMLAEELGLEPGPELRALEEAILRQDDALTWRGKSERPEARSRPAASQPARDGRTGPRAPDVARPGAPADAWLTPRHARSFVGRGRELSALRGLVTEVAKGAAGVALVEGPAGIGKSRLVGEMLTEARAMGFEVVYGRAEELERTRPFGVLMDALECHPASPDPDRALIARLVTEGPEEGDESRPGLEFRVIELFGRALERLAADTPVVVALEDLHWADASTLVAFRWLGRRLGHLPLLLVATFRPVPVRPELLGLVEAFSAEGALHLRVAGLDEEAVEALVFDLVGAPPGPSLRDRVGGAAGNPFFVSELVTALVEDDRVGFADGRAEVRGTAVPPTLRATVLRRLRGLPEETVEVLRLASVLGPTFSAQELSLASGEPAFRLLSALEAAMRAGLLRESASQLTFEHDLVREAIYGDLPHAVRAALHQDVGRALAGAGAPAPRVATHLALGASPGDQETVAWLRRAAREVNATSAGVAAELLEGALALLRPDDADRPAVMAELASALMWAGRVTDGVAIAEELLALHHEPAFEGALRLALGRALMMLGRPKEAVAVAETGAGLAGIPDWQGVQLRADAAFAHMLNGDLRTARDAARSVRGSSAPPGDDLIVAVSTLSTVAMFRGELDEAIRLAREVVDAVDRCSDPWLSHFPSHYWLALSLTLADRLAEASEVVDAGQRASRQRGNVWVLPSLHGARALGRFLAGRWDEAVEEARTSVALSGDVGARQGLVFAHTVLSLVALHRGDLDAAEQALRVGSREPDLPYFTPWMAHARAVLEDARGNPGAAFALLAAAWEQARDLGIACVYPNLGPDLVRLSVLRGETALAGDVVAEAENAASRMHTVSATGAALRCRGLLAGDADVLVEAAATYRKGPRPVELASACEEAGIALAGIRMTEAVALLEEARGLYQRAGADRDALRVATALRRLGVGNGGGGRVSPPVPSG